MKRLTERLYDNIVSLKNVKEFNLDNEIAKAMQKLAAYEDTGLEPEEIKDMIKAYNRESTIAAHYEQLEEQGLLIELPCKVGDTLYIVSSRLDGKGHVRRLTLTHNNLRNVLKRLDDDIFKTREEAEKALEASNGE